MIPTCGVTALVGFDTFAVGVCHDQDVALAAGLVTDCPALYAFAPRRGRNNMNGSCNGAIPCALPVWFGGTTREKDEKVNSDTHHFYDSTLS